jgi:soluble lytic murein transglycosylase-like protein
MMSYPLIRAHYLLRGAGVACAIALAGAAGSASAQIYAGASASGAVVLSNFATDETPQMVVALPPVAALVVPPAAPATLPAIVDPRNPGAAYRTMVDQVAKEVSMSPQLLHAVIQVESGYQPRARSPKGAQGLMQLMPATAERFGVRDAFDPRQNIRGGALYLKWLLEYFRGDLRLALAAYNAGEAAVVKAGYRIPPFAETRDYVPKVLWHFNHPVGNG